MLSAKDAKVLTLNKSEERLEGFIKKAAEFGFTKVTLYNNNSTLIASYDEQAIIHSYTIYEHVTQGLDTTLKQLGYQVVYRPYNRELPEPDSVVISWE